jgi:diaminohydroxyphosphoribosylaminopyrimidine deaminase/5-amino-6-(5-phosphoribosylamino)uracil reductase
MMRAALALARRSLGRTWPNPAVGCVIVKDGRWSRAAAPATAAAARRGRRAGQAGEAARGATVYVTPRAVLALSASRRPAPMPWSRPGRQVVSALEDPNPG